MKPVSEIQTHTLRCRALFCPFRHRLLKCARMDEIKHREQVDLIREVFYYQNRFDGKTIVLKIDYPILNTAHFPQLLKDMAMLRSTGIEIILIPGAKEWIDAVLKEY